MPVSFGSDFVGANTSRDVRRVIVDAVARSADDNSAAWPQPKIRRGMVCREKTRNEFQDTNFLTRHVANQVQKFASAAQELNVCHTQIGLTRF